MTFASGNANSHIKACYAGIPRSSGLCSRFRRCLCSPSQRQSCHHSPPTQHNTRQATILTSSTPCHSHVEQPQPLQPCCQRHGFGCMPPVAFAMSQTRGPKTTPKYLEQVSPQTSPSALGPLVALLHTQVPALPSARMQPEVYIEPAMPFPDAVQDPSYPSEADKPPPLAGPNVMNVVMVGAECAPWSKTGGLGDVMGALPKALARRGHRVMCVAPRCACKARMPYHTRSAVTNGKRCILWSPYKSLSCELVCSVAS